MVEYVLFIHAPLNLYCRGFITGKSVGRREVSPSSSARLSVVEFRRFAEARPSVGIVTRYDHCLFPFSQPAELCD